MSAAERIEAFLAERSQMIGLDPDDITGANDAWLRVSDLRAIIAERDRARGIAVALEQRLARVEEVCAIGMRVQAEHGGRGARASAAADGVRTTVAQVLAALDADQ